MNQHPIDGILQELSEKLDQAASIGDKDERRGVIQSLGYVTQTLHSLGFTARQTDPLVRLLGDLQDLTQGVQPSMLKKDKVSGAPVKGHRESWVNAMAAVLIDVLVDNDNEFKKPKSKKRKDAASTVAGFMQNNDIPMPGRENSTLDKRLLNWVDNNIYKGNNPSAEKSYNVMSKEVQKMEALQAEDALKQRMKSAAVQSLAESLDGSDAPE
jgi:hypothetical protein